MRRLLVAALLLIAFARAASATDGFIQVPPDGAGKMTDMSVVSTNSGTVYRQRFNLCDPTNGSICAAIDAVLGLPVNVTNPSIAASQSGAWSMSVSNFPSSQNVVCTSGCSGSSGSTFGAAFPSTGTAIGMTQGGNLTALSGTSGNLNVAVSNFPATQPVSGSVSVSNFPATQPVSGTVSVGNFPATQPVSGTVAATQSGTWTVQPGNTANTTAWKVDGSAVTQPVSGSGTFTTSDTHYPAAAALSDALANPTTTLLGSDNLGWDATNTVWRRLQVDAGTGTLKVDPGTVAVTGTFFQATQPVSGTVTANAGTGTFTVSGTVTANAGTSLNTSALALDATAAKLNSAQGSTTSGETGPLIQGAVTTAAPTYTTAQTSPLSLTTAGALRTDSSATTQPVSGTVTTSPPANASSNVAQINGVTPLMGNGITGTGSPRVTIASDNTAFSVNAAQSGTWTVQPGNTANTTAWKVDGSAVTQPVSGTVTDNQGTANTAANAWPTKLTDGTNVAAVKAASTAAAATDPSAVAQLSPNQPQLTTPLNIQGGKTNNNAAPGATNVGALDILANAAPPTWTEGDLVTGSADLGGNQRVYSHPPNVLGCYQINSRTPTYTGLAAAAPLYSLRWGDATHIAIIWRVQIFVLTTASATTAGLTERELVIARSFTASDTGGTAIVLTGNNNKMRTSQGTSLVTDMRFGGALTAGTRTLDVNAVASVAGWSPLTTVGIVIGSAGAASGEGFVDLFNATNGQQYPIVLATNEGIIVRIGKDAEASGATQQTYLNVNWCEASAY